MTKLNVLLNGQASRRFRVMLLFSSPATKSSSGYFAQKSEKTPIIDQLSELYNIKMFRWTKRCEQSISLKRVYLLDGVNIILSLLNCLLKGHFNVIVTTGLPVLESIPTFVIAKLLGVPVILRETHWYWPNTLLSKFTWPLNKLMVSNCNLIICPGKKACAYWQSLGIPKKKLKIVPFYASILEVNPEIVTVKTELRAKFQQKTVILCFGRLIEKKGVAYLINAFARLQKEFSNIFLLVAGDGPERQNLEQLCRELELSNYEFIGAVDEKIKSAFFFASDIYVYPSITTELPEEWPLGVVEAMSIGKPVIVTTAVGSAPDVIETGLNGYVVPEKDSYALYVAMKNMLKDGNVINRMGAASKRVIETCYTYHHAVEGLDNAVKTVIEKR